MCEELSPEQFKQSGSIDIFEDVKYCEYKINEEESNGKCKTITV
jgi:hypothetical protein